MSEQEDTRISQDDKDLLFNLFYSNAQENYKKSQN
jgi:hypothetical protein